MTVTVTVTVTVTQAAGRADSESESLSNFRMSGMPVDDNFWSKYRGREDRDWRGIGPTQNVARSESRVRVRAQSRPGRRFVLRWQNGRDNATGLFDTSNRSKGNVAACCSLTNI
jgi:hypothetical protein